MLLISRCCWVSFSFAVIYWLRVYRPCTHFNCIWLLFSQSLVSVVSECMDSSRYRPGGLRRAPHIFNLSKVQMEMLFERLIPFWCVCVGWRMQDKHQQFFFSFPLKSRGQVGFAEVGGCGNSVGAVVFQLSLQITCNKLCVHLSSSRTYTL